MRRFLPACCLLFALHAQQGPTFSSSSRLVIVNAVVLGKNNTPITGLTKDDFQLFDNGQPQHIALFSEPVTSAKPSANPNTAAAELPPNVFSNRIPPAVKAQPNATVILLDALNTDIQDQSFARDQVVRFLRQIQPGDHIGIYALGTGLRVIHDFTTDSSDLLAALNKYGVKTLSSSPGETGATTVVTPTPSGLPNSSNNAQNPASDPINLKGLFSLQGSTAEQDFFLKNRIDSTLKALTFIAEHLAVFPGRKSLIWVSGGFPLSVGYGGPDGFSAENKDRSIHADAFRRAMQIVNSANIAIYPVDAHGVLMSGNYAGAATARPNNSTIDITAADQQQTMRTLASDTGGKAFINRNDLDHAITEAIADSEVSYTIGFYPDQQKFDGAYHKLTLKLDRPHSDLRYRAGYLDLAKPSHDQKARQADLAVTAASPVDANGIGLEAQVLPGRASGKPAGKDSLQITVQINPKTLTLTPKDGLTMGQLDVLFLQRDEVGKTVDVFNNSIDLKLGTAEMAKIRRFGILFNKDLVRARTAESLRIIVRDVDSGASGSITVPLAQLVPATN
jgi:VWFA-related protein